MMGLARLARPFLSGTFLVAACTVTEPPPPPEARPERASTSPVAPTRVAAPAPSAPGPSAESDTLRAYYARVEERLRERGLLRTEGGGPDTPWNADRLAETFLEVALYDEYDTTGAAYVARRTESHLRRWDQPVRIQTRFGPTVEPAQRERDRARVADYAARLSDISGHPIDTVARGGNFTVFFIGEDARRDLGPELRRLVPGLSDAAVRAVTDLPRSTYCVVFATDDRTGRYQNAVAVVRAEQPPLLREACIHEEVAQGLGLSNDTPMARPSIFNDNEEFALLTPHDAQLLRILYDPRLSPGMDLAEAQPIVQEIAAELVGE